MDFAIEVPGHANPLTADNLYRTLISGSSVDQQQLRSSALQLQNWKKQPGYYSLLQSIFIDTSLPTEIRYLAVIQLKNGIDKYWRKSSQNAIANDEKAQIRSRCLAHGLTEPDHRLALYNALSVAKIFRFDYPQDWYDWNWLFAEILCRSWPQSVLIFTRPQAIEELLVTLRLASSEAEPSLRISRALLILLHATKVLAARPLIRIRANLPRDAPRLLESLREIYLNKVTFWRSFLETGDDDEGGALDSIEQSLLALRVLRRLLIAAYDFPNRHIEVQEFWTVLGAQLGQMLNIVLQKTSSLDVSAKRLIGKHVVQLAKLHLSMAQSHPAGFALLPHSTDLACTYWRAITHLSENFGSQEAILPLRIGTDSDVEDDEMAVLEKISLKGLLLIRACVKMVFNPAQSFEYQGEDVKAEQNRSRELIKESLLTDDFAREMMETLVTRLFVLRLRDLRGWEEEPEEWERREEGEGHVWKFSIRSCSRKLFLDLVVNYKDLLIQPLLDVFSKVACKFIFPNQVPFADGVAIHNTDILLKDSIYAAIGLAARVLNERLDFGAFLASTLISEVRIQQPGYNILRRRTAIVLGQWLPVKDGLDRTLVYQIFQHLLNKDNGLNDQVVRVTAGRQFRHVLAPFNFTAELFTPHAPPILGSLMQLVEEVELGETKMALLRTISVIIVRMGHQISPFADQIVSLLPPLWDQAGDLYFMKYRILAILNNLVTSMKDQSRRYHPMIIPILASSVEPSSETRVYLLEDAMELWGLILVHTAHPVSQETISLAQYLFPLYESTSETLLRKALKITETYMKLIPELYLSVAPALLTPLVPLLTTKRYNAACLVTELVELLIRTAEYTGGPQAVANLTVHLVATNFLPTLLDGIQSAYSVHRTTGPNLVTSLSQGQVRIASFRVIARLILASPQIFLSALEVALPQDTLEINISRLLTEWFSHIDNIGDPTDNKLSCLALAALLEANQPWILSRLQELMTVWANIITDFIDHETGSDSLIYWDMEFLKLPGPDELAREQSRKLAYADPVRRLDTKVFVRQKLEAAVTANGGREAFERNWLIHVDENVVRRFKALGVV